MLMAGFTQEHISKNVLDALRAIVTAKIGHAVSSEAMLTGEKMCVWFMQPADKGNFIHAQAAVKGLAEEIQETVRMSISVHITFVFDEEELAWRDVPERLASLRNIARDHLDEHKGLALVSSRFFKELDKEPEHTVKSTAFVGHVLTHIRENLGGDLSLTALSELVYLNPSYLSRRFKEVTGRNLADTIMKLRMEEACRMLKNTSNRVKNIATRLGYESVAHFCRIFKKETGFTPQEYRNMNIVKRKQ
jgi:two-component system response regulator YesN